MRPGASRPHRLLQKSLPAHAVRSLIIARKKLVGQRVTLENQIRGLAVVFGVRLPRALSLADEHALALRIDTYVVGIVAELDARHGREILGAQHVYR